MPEKLITEDGSCTWLSPRYGETFHSIHGALTESRHVYLRGTQTESRLQHAAQARVLEVGFGLGLNFLVTGNAAIDCQAQLEYHALEHALFPARELATLDYAAVLSHQPLSTALNAYLQSDQVTVGVSNHSELLAGIHLHLHLFDASKGALPPGPFDAIYLDAFSPLVNPECWTAAFLGTLFNRLRPGGMLSTYCVKGDVRRRLIALGFIVRKEKGPPGKREILVAMRPPENEQ